MNNYIYTQKVVFDEELQSGIEKGVKLLAKAVGCTLGPGGQRVAYEVSGSGAGDFILTKDGVTVANALYNVKDQVQQAAIQLIKDAARKTAVTAGDGTTTSTILAAELYLKGVKIKKAGYNMPNVIRGMEQAMEVVLKVADSYVTPCNTKKDLIDIATISANNDAKIGKLVGETAFKMGEIGRIGLDYGRKEYPEVEIIKGMRWMQGLADEKYQNLVGGHIVLDNPFIMVIGYEVRTQQHFIPILEKIVRTGRPLLIVLDQCNLDVDAMIRANNKSMLMCRVRLSKGTAEDSMEQARDIAAATGATILGPGMEAIVDDCDIKHLGSAKRVIVTRQDTTILEGGGSRKAIEVRMNQIRAHIEKIKDDDRCTKEEIDYFKNKLSTVNGRIAVIRSGGKTYIEMKETFFRLEDAIEAVRAAAQQGMVPGGGIVYANAINEVEKLTLKNPDQQAGVKIVKEALMTPLSTIAINAGHDPYYIIDQVKRNKSKTMGFDAVDGTFKDMRKAGVVDPAKVCKVALENAVSIASLLLSTNAVIAAEPNKDEE